MSEISHKDYITTTSNGVKKTILIIIVILTLVIGGYFLLRGGYQAPEVTAPEEEIAPAPEGEVIEIREITVLGTEFSFSPASITVSAGERVKITFRNDGRASHNLVVEGLGVRTGTIGSGQTDTIEFTAPTSGNYTFFCSVSGHRTAGMTGQLIIE